ncbi:hypothetical protein G0Q03_19340 [Epibacterium mobile]|nr:hypothetical protein [Tritonibacter mobilis]
MGTYQRCVAGLSEVIPPTKAGAARRVASDIAAPYYRNEVIDLEEDHSAARLDPGRGSELFSVQFSAAAHWDGSSVRQPKEDFCQSVYFIDQEPEYAAKLNAALSKFNEAYNKEVMNSPEALEAIKSFTPEKANNPNWLRESISSETYIACAQRAQRIAPMPRSC